MLENFVFLINNRGMDSFRIPNKKYFKDIEVAKIINVSKRVIYFWETKLSLFSPKINSENEKLYTRDELLLFIKIKELIIDENKSFEDVYKILKEEKRTAEKNINIKQKKDISILREIKKEIKEILTILKK